MGHAFSTPESYDKITFPSQVVFGHGLYHSNRNPNSDSLTPLGACLSLQQRWEDLCEFKASLVLKKKKKRGTVSSLRYTDNTDTKQQFDIKGVSGQCPHPVRNTSHTSVAVPLLSYLCRESDAYHPDSGLGLPSCHPDNIHFLLGLWTPKHSWQCSCSRQSSL